MEVQAIDAGKIKWEGLHVHKPFRKVSVLGAGTMGAQIAAHFANAGIQVNLLDIAPEDGPKNAIVEAAFKKIKKLKPDPFALNSAADQIRLGNFDEHLDWLKDSEWVIEVVVERMDIKRALMERIEQHVSDSAIISTNTSGLPINQIAEGRSTDFKRRFLGTHFFNPPRYLKLLELIPTQDTDPEITQRIAHFGRVHLGKGIVVAKDTPNFIGNRIGVFALMKAVQAFTQDGYTVEEVDTLTGPLTGRPKSATFRTADVVGLDVMKHVAANLYDNILDDESREAFKVPDVLNALIEAGALGAKTRAGFYKKEGKEIKSINPATGSYESAKPLNLGAIDQIKKAGGLADRMKLLYEDSGRAGTFFRKTTHELIAYSAMRIPEISDNPADVDRALQWGFGWEMGPFATWDALGFDQILSGIREEGLQVPEWVAVMESNGIKAFYKQEGDVMSIYTPGAGGYVREEMPADEYKLATIKSKPGSEIWSNEEAGLVDMGDGVALFEFRSKANSLGFNVIQGIIDAIGLVENNPDLRGIVIANEGKNFSVGANLGELAGAAMEKRFDVIDKAIANFQAAAQRIRYALKPVVVAPHQRVLGGGCEITMAGATQVAALESYMGLVELGVGLVPAGTGTAFLAALASDKSASKFPSQILDHLQVYFQNVAMAKVATSAHMAKEMGYLSPQARIVMHDGRRFHVAKQAVIDLSESGYLPPPVHTHIKVLGVPGRAALEVAARQFEQGRFISEYDRFLAVQLAHILTGGELSGPTEVHEDYLIDLEREVFLKLLGEEKTQARIKHILTTNKPLRN